MEKIKPLHCYNLINEDGKSLRMYLGVITQGFCGNGNDEGLRWMFEGKEIPMPVRSRTWFNGFPEPIMLEWLKGNGWVLRVKVDMCSGNAIVYELLDANKGNHVSTGNDALDDANRRVFHGVIKELCKANRKIEAVRLYRYAHGGSLGDANMAVNAIRDSIH